MSPVNQFTLSPEAIALVRSALRHRYNDMRQSTYWKYFAKRKPEEYQAQLELTEQLLEYIKEAE
jgi:hypothetical protein